MANWSMSRTLQLAEGTHTIEVLAVIGLNFVQISDYTTNMEGLQGALNVLILKK